MYVDLGVRVPVFAAVAERVCVRVTVHDLVVVAAALAPCVAVAVLEVVADKLEVRVEVTV